MKNILIIVLILITGNLLAQDYFDTDTTYVMNGKKYHLSTQDLGESQDSILYKVTCGKKMILNTKKEKYGAGGWELLDFNKDGYPDIQISYIGNNATYELFLFNPKADKYIEVEGFIFFPEAEALATNSNYYYSYHRAGCADMNWVSDLFTIESNKTIHLGEIYGQGCDYGEGDAAKVDISIVLNNNEEDKKLIKTIPYDEIFTDSEDKWEFIKKYWNANYELFLKKKAH